MHPDAALTTWSPSFCVARFPVTVSIAFIGQSKCLNGGVVVQESGLILKTCLKTAFSLTRPSLGNESNFTWPSISLGLEQHGLDSQFQMETSRPPFSSPQWPWYIYFCFSYSTLLPTLKNMHYMLYYMVLYWRQKKSPVCNSCKDAWREVMRNKHSNTHQSQGCFFFTYNRGKLNFNVCLYCAVAQPEPSRAVFGIKSASDQHHMPLRTPRRSSFRKTLWRKTYRCCALDYF